MKDYRSFLFVAHEAHGLLMLQCSRKANKPVHWQVPGGHVDLDDFPDDVDDAAQRLLQAAKVGAARELYEETGIDVRQALGRLESATLRLKPKIDEQGEPILDNEFKDRIFFVLRVTDADFAGNNAPNTTKAIDRLSDGAPITLSLRISEEHSGFTFDNSLDAVFSLLEWHSGGKVSKALAKYAETHPGNHEKPKTITQLFCCGSE